MAFYLTTNGPRSAALVTEDGVLQVAAVPGPAVANQFWSQTDWFVDPVNGLDANPGSAAAPVQTVMGGIVAKWGTTTPILPQTTTIHVVNPQATGAEYIVLNPIMAGAFNFVIVGTPALVQTLVPATLTPKNRATPQQLQITVTAGQAALIAPGQLVQDQTRGSTATVDAVAGTTITLTQPFTTLATANASRALAPAEDDGWAATDTLNFLVQPTLNLRNFTFQAGVSAAGAAGAGIAFLQNLSIPDPSGTAGASVFAPSTVDGALNMVDCAVAPQCSATLVTAPSAFNGIANAFVVRLVNLWAPGGVQFSGGSKLFGGSTPSFGSNGYNAIDGDAYVKTNLEVMSGLLNVEGLYLAAAAFARVFPSSAVRQLASLVAGFVWGPGLIVLDGGTWSNVAGSYVAKMLITGALRIDVAAGTGSSYNPATGAWTSGIAVTAANIDAAAGAALINPPTGGKFTSAL